MALGIYTVKEAYVNSLMPIAPHLFHNSKEGQTHSRKYIGVVLTVGGFNYFAPLSSFKPKHARMKNSLDFIKIGDYAVINLNCMFPVPEGMFCKVDIRKERDSRYRDLLLAELRVIRRNESRIKHNAEVLYRYKLTHGNDTKLAERCNDFLAIEAACLRYRKDKGN